MPVKYVLLANYLSQIENISYNEACVEILKFSRKAKLKLQKGEKIVFENIGILILNDAEKIEFTVNNVFNFDRDSFGLRDFQFAKLETKQNTTTPEKR